MKICYHCMSKIESNKKDTCPYCNKKLDDKKESERFLQPGTLLQGKFLVGHSIGYGGFGNTYIGWNELLLRKVAIKEYFPEQFCHRATDGTMVTTNGGKYEIRFRRGLHNFLEEARNVAALQDIKGVVKISNFFEENGTGYIVMEYLEGMDVKTILKASDKKKDFEWSRRVILTVLHTLREVHARGVLHRDIAPDNIFVTNDGVIKLIDFGAAKHSSELEIGSGGEIILKKGYSPIEQYGNSIPQGPYTDLYGVAALFYRMLTGQKPLPADSRIINDGLLAPSDMGIEIPQQAEFAIMICLNLRPEYRLQTADEFMEALGGQSFVPVYEPEWILPKVKDNDTISSKFKNLPLSAKIALGFSVLMIATGLIFTRYAIHSTKDAAMAVANTATLQDLSGKSMEEAEKYINNLNSRYDLNLEIQGDTYVYNSSEELDGTIKEQSIPVGTDLQDLNQLSDFSLYDLYLNEQGKLSGVIHCSINSVDKISYKELQDKNAYEISKMLEKDITDPMFVKENEKGQDDQTYWSLLRIVMKDGNEILQKEIQDQEKKLETIEIEDIKSIRYYGYEFFAWDKLPDFAEKYKDLKHLQKQKFDVYDYVDETNIKVITKKTLMKNFIDDSYYSLNSSYPDGTIVGQTIAAGQQFNGSVDTGLKIKTIKKYISTDGMTASQAKERIKDNTKNAKNIKINVSNGDGNLSSISVRDEKGKTVSYFKDNVTIDIVGQEVKRESNESKEKKPKKKPATKPKKKKKPNSSGSGMLGTF